MRQRGIKNLLVRNVTATSFASLIIPSIAGQSTPFGVPVHLKDLFKALDLILCLRQVGLKTLLELRVSCLLVIFGRAFVI